MGILPGGVLLTARVKYNYELATLHFGYTYNHYLVLSKIIIGEGLS